MNNTKITQIFKTFRIIFKKKIFIANNECAMSGLVQLNIHVSI